MLSLLNVSGGLSELFDWFRAAFAAWRYLFSSSYRRQVHERWRSEGRFYIAWEIICAVAGFALTIFLGYVLVSLFARFDWLSRLLAFGFHS